jgi:hypothetical protein
MTGQRKQTYPRSERGAAMLAALCLAMVFAICLSSYIALCYTSLMMSTRNVMNSLSSELAEAGFEQALYAENNGDWTGWTRVGSTATAAMTMTASGLVATSNNPTALSYGNGVTGKVNITITNYTSSTPSIASQGVMSIPAGTLTSGNAKTTVSRTLTFTASSTQTASMPFFVNAVAAISGAVKFKSAGTIDSFSSNPRTGVYQNYSNSGPTADNTASAVVLSEKTNSLSARVQMGNAVLNGYAVGYTSYYPGTTNWISYGSSAKVIGPSTPSGTQIDSNRLLTNSMPYQPVFNEKLPTSWNSFPSGCDNTNAYPWEYYVINQTSSLGSPTATTPTVYEIGNGIQLSGSSVLSIAGPVVLISYGDVTISGNAQIQLTNSNSSLTIFEEYGNMNIGGLGITYKGTVTYPLAKQVMLLDTTNTWSTVTFSTNTAFYGVIYFPYQAITVSSTAPVIYGSIVGASVTFNNSPTIHYDEALRKPDSNVSSAAFQSLYSPYTVSGLVQSVP